MPDPGHLVRARNAQRNAMRFFNEGNDVHATLNASLALSSSILALTEMMEKRGTPLPAEDAPAGSASGDATPPVWDGLSKPPIGARVQLRDDLWGKRGEVIETQGELVVLAIVRWDGDSTPRTVGMSSLVPEAEAKPTRYGEKRVVLRRADEVLEGTLYSLDYFADEPPLIEVDGLPTLTSTAWRLRGWTILDRNEHL